MLTWIFALASQEDPAPGGWGGSISKSPDLRGLLKKSLDLRKLSDLDNFLVMSNVF